MPILARKLIQLLLIISTISFWNLTYAGIIEKSIAKTDQKLHYTISVKYPDYPDPQLQTLNQEIIKQINKTVKQFKANIEKNQKPIADLPLNEDSNTLTITYKIVSHSSHVISLLFTIDTFFYGAAHPNSSFIAINFALSPPHLLTLKNLFKHNADYLTKFEKYARPVLTKQLNKDANAAPGEQIEPYPEGLKPVPSNYAIWNIAPEGLLLTFPAYQVAPYVFGAQHVVIPYSDLKSMLKDNVLLP